MTVNNFDDLEYWANRFMNCFPATYPPELYTTKEVKHVVRYGIFGFGTKYGYHTQSVCARCGDRIMTGHTCKDISEYIKVRRSG